MENDRTAGSELTALISRVAGKCLLVMQAHVKAAVEVSGGDGKNLDPLWTESVDAQKSELEWIDVGCAKVARAYESLKSAGGVSEIGLQQLGRLIYRMGDMVGIATSPSGTFEHYYAELQKTVNAYVSVYQETKAMPEFAE